MKIQYAKIALTAAMITFTGLAMANQVTVVNASKKQQPMQLVYKIAHQNPGQLAVYSSPQSVTISGSTSIPVELEGYKLAGIVPISVNGVDLPPNVVAFNTSDMCSLTTDATHPNGIMELKMRGHPGGHEHGKLNCSIKGGLYR